MVPADIRRLVEEEGKPLAIVLRIFDEALDGQHGPAHCVLEWLDVVEYQLDRQET